MKLDNEINCILIERIRRLEAEIYRYLYACVPLDELIIVELYGQPSYGRVIHKSQLASWQDEITC